GHDVCRRAPLRLDVARRCRWQEARTRFGGRAGGRDRFASADRAEAGQPACARRIAPSDARRRGRVAARQAGRGDYPGRHRRGGRRADRADHLRRARSSRLRAGGVLQRAAALGRGERDSQGRARRRAVDATGATGSGGMTEQVEVKDQQARDAAARAADYEHGWSSEIETEFAPKGLSEDTVRFISAKKGEPEWMLEWRLKAFRLWQEMEEPNWAKL